MEKHCGNCRFSGIAHSMRGINEPYCKRHRKWIGDTILCSEWEATVHNPSTKGDAVRAMSDEELAVMLASPYLTEPPWCAEHRTCPYIDEDPAPCDKCALDWLRQEDGE